MEWEAPEYDPGWDDEESDGEVIDRRLRFYGAAAQYLANTDKEVVCESGAGTGKSFSVMAKANYTARQYPGSRQLWAMATRVAMNTTILPDWENDILWPGHPAIHGTATYEHRAAYEYPNGSRIDLVGLDKPGKVLSAKFDRFTIFQAEQSTKEAWETLLTRLRATNTPYRQATADVNPESQFHWINRRADQTFCLSCGHQGELTEAMCPDCETPLQRYMSRLCYRHHDNPLWFDHAAGRWTDLGVEYVRDTLGRLTGVQRERLLLHRWVAATGLVLSNWDAGVHMLSGHLERNVDGRGGYWLHVFGWKDPILLLWFGAGMDWGYAQDPGVVSVWGYDAMGRRFRVAETYRLGWQIDQWAEVAEGFVDEFDLRYIACDPSRPDLIDMLNQYLGAKGGRDGVPLARPANNSLTKKMGKGMDLTGVDLMRWGLRSGTDGLVRTYLLHGALRHGADPQLVQAGKPTCTEQEAPQWTLEKQEDGRPAKDRPDQSCEDHGLDAWRYEQSEGWGKEMSSTIQKAAPKPGSIGDILGHGRAI